MARIAESWRLRAVVLLFTMMLLLTGCVPRLPAWYRVGSDGSLAIAPCDEVAFSGMKLYFDTNGSEATVNRIGPVTELAVGEPFVIEPVPEGWARTPGADIPVEWAEFHVQLGREGAILPVVRRSEIEDDEWTSVGGSGTSGLIAAFTCPAPADPP